MQKLNYDYYNNIEVPTFVLSNVYHHHIGMINNIDIESIQYSFNMNARQEVSFDIYKELNGEKCDLWDKIIDLKYVYIPEHDEYYVLAVSTDDSDNTVKHCSLTSAGEYELSNKIIRSLEINTESDILRNVDDASKPPNPPYAPNVLCNFDDPDNSILHRALKDKAPDWSVAHCDETIAHIQRTFTVTNQKIYDFLTGTLAKEYDCLFQFDSVNRTISCYDLLNICEDCGERGEFVYECPNCGSKKIHYGYGKNTNIFITYNNFSEKITRDGDEGAVKNCFHVTGGDDYINSTIRNINPNGSPYIYNFSQQDYEDMPPALVEGLEAYQAKYDELYEPYQEVTAKWYDAINNYYFYKTSMMPRSGGALWEAEKGYNLNDETYVKTLASWAYLKCVKSGVSGTEEFDASNVLNGQIIEDGTVQWQVCKNIITPSTAEQSYNDIVTYFQSNQIYFLTSIPTTLTQVNNEVINISQLQINNLYKVDVVSDGNNKVEGTKWYGRLKVTNSGNAEDTYKSDVTLEINLRVVNALPEYVSYMEDKVVKRINRSDKTFINLYELDNDTEFKLLLTQYGLDSLSSFSKSYQNCIDVLIANGIKDENSTYMGWKVYDPIYLPTYNRKTWVDEELAKRETTVKKWENLRDDYRKAMDDIQNQLNLTNFLSDDLLRTFYNYIREDTYTNSNYISTGLSDGEVINNAKELLKVAEKELKKASELQVTLNDTIKNLLNTDEFKNYKDKYNLGDFIFVECDGDDWEDNAEKNRGLYRLRLISASYSFSSPGDINFTFSNVTKVQNFFSDAQSIINSAQTISGSYNAVVHQVKNNSDTSDLVNTWTNEGLESAKSIIANNNNEEVTMGEYGIYAKEYDDIKDEYSPEQLRITHNNITFTDDNWETAALAIGKNTFRYYNTDVSQGEIGWITKTDYGVNAKFLEAGYVIGGQIIGSEVVSTNYHVADPEHGIEADGSFIDLNDGSFSLGGGGLIGYKDQETGAYYLNYNGNFTGIVDVDVGSELGVWTVGADGFYSGTSVLKPSDIAVTGNIRAADFYVGTSTTTTLSSILNGKQDTLIPGTNITIDPTTNTISASSGTEVEANPSGTPTDTLTTIEIDNTIYDIDGGTDVEANPVETATDTLNSIKIDDTVYEIVGGGIGGVEMHQGIDVPDSSLGNNDDIYLQMESTIGNLLSFDASHSGLAITNYSATVTDNKWDITATFINHWEYHSYAVYSLQNLTVGKKYAISFDFQNDGTPPLYGKGELFGLTLQHINRPIDMRNWSSDLVENGEFKYFEDSYYGEWWYQSFPHDTKRVHYEFEFTARQGTEYIGFYGDRTSGNLTCSLYELCVGDKVQTNEIKDVYYKLNNQWSLYDRNVTLYHGLDTPSDSLGDEHDLYLRMKGNSEDVVQEYSEVGGGMVTYEVTRRSATSYDFHQQIRGNSSWDHVIYPLHGLIDGNSYTVTFTQKFTNGRFYGGYTDRIYVQTETEDTGADLYPDNESHNFSFTFTAGTTNDLVFSYPKCEDGLLIDSDTTNFSISGSFVNGIKDIYGKVDGKWQIYEAYEAGDNITIVDGIISATDTDEIAELKDVSLTNLANGQIIKYNATTQKWENAEDSGGSEVEANPSGTATDTLTKLGIDGTIYEIQGGGGGVGGSSVYSEKVLYKASDNTFTNIQVDFTKDYDVYVFYCNDVITQKSESYYYVKSEIEEAIKDNILISMYPYGSEGYCQYNISNSGLTTLTNRAGFFIYKIVGLKFGTLSPIIYSTEEREVGVWTDGKPLYQKTFERNLTLPSATWVVTGDSIPNGQVVKTEATKIDSISDSILTWGEIGSDGHIELINIRPVGSITISHYTMWYTKTTDVAGSAQYTTLGVPAHHYDGNEKIVGTWFGETLYEKTMEIVNSTKGSVTINLTGMNISRIVKKEGIWDRTNNQDTYWMDFGVYINSEIYSYLSDDIGHNRLYMARFARSNETLTKAYITIRYTKTSN